MKYIFLALSICTLCSYWLLIWIGASGVAYHHAVSAITIVLLCVMAIFETGFAETAQWTKAVLQSQRGRTLAVIMLVAFTLQSLTPLFVTEQSLVLAWVKAYSGVVIFSFAILSGSFFLPAHLRLATLPKK